MLKELIASWINSYSEGKGYAEVGKHFKQVFDIITATTLRDYSPDTGGELGTPERKMASGTFATVSSTKLKHEEGLTRAMFNRRELNLRSADVSGSDSQEHKMIAYEAPLQRAPDGEDKPEDGKQRISRSMSCDLIAMASNPFHLTAVEVKQSKNKQTNLDYGLVEAWLYAQAMARLVSDDEISGGKSRYEHLRLEIQDCLKAYEIDTEYVIENEASKCGIEYVVAAPPSYFREQFVVGAVDQEKIKKAIEQLQAPVEPPASSKPKFGGFWVLPCVGRDSLILAEPEPEGGYRPTLNSNELVLCPDVDSLYSLVIDCRPA